MGSRVMDAETPTANYESPSSPTPTGVSITQGNSSFHRLARVWFALRWRLAETVFSRPLPWITATLDLKVGDVLMTLPVAIGFIVYNAVQCSKLEVSASGTAPMVLMIIVFALTVRNNSILLSVTGLPFERALLYHKLFGAVSVVVTGLHGLAYLLEDAGVMAARRSRRRLEEFKEPTLPTETSGAIAFYLLVALYIFSLSPLRRRFYELFLRTHVLLFIGIVVFSTIHGAGLVLIGVGIWALDAVFRHGYLVPRHLKGSPCTKQQGVIARGQVSAVKLPGEIVRLQFPRVRTDTGECFHYKAGQYAFVCVSTLGYLEWHPFTISSSPHEALVTIHIKVLGDWTRRLLTLVAAQASSDRDVATPALAPFLVLLDGCYGQVSVDVVDPTTYAHVMLFSGGIGVTPMQSIVNQLYFEHHHLGRHALKHVRFVWSVRDRDMLQALLNRDFVESKKLTNQREAWSPYLPDALLTTSGNNAVHDVFVSEIFLTKGEADMANAADQQLQHCIRYNRRPDIRETLKGVGDDAKRSGKARVAVLVCGPAAMVKQVVSDAISLSSEMNVSFDVHTEKFDF